MGGVVKCPVHVRGAAAWTCSHVAKQIDARQPPSGHRFTIVGHFFVCDACYQSLGLEQYASVPDLKSEISSMSDARFEAAMDAFDAAHRSLKDVQARCIKCIAELEPHNSTA